MQKTIFLFLTLSSLICFASPSPDLQTLEAKLNQLEAQVQTLKTEQKATPNNPSWVQLDTQDPYILMDKPPLCHIVLLLF